MRKYNPREGSGFTWSIKATMEYVQGLDKGLAGLACGQNKSWHVREERTYDGA